MEKLSAAYLIVAALGIGLAIYTAYEYITLDFRTCTINQQFSCGAVAGSGYTSLFGIPFYVAGLAWFPLIFLIGLVTSKLGKTSVNNELLLPVLMVGNIFTVYLWYLELVVIHAICPLCLSLYIVNYVLTGIVVIGLWRSSSAAESEAVEPEAST